MKGPVLCVQHHAPDKICCKSAPEQYNIGNIILEQWIESSCHCFLRHGLPCLNAKIKTGAHDARKDGNKDSLYEIEFRNCSPLFFLRQFLFLQHPCPSANVNAQE